MSPRLTLQLALGSALGLIAAYVLAGGASFEPLDVDDPCEARPEAVLAERGVFEGLALSALDGAACELQVSREELSGALADEQLLDSFARRYDVSEDRLDDAVRAALIRAVEDAERQGRLQGPAATAARFVAANAPVGVALDLFRALPGDPTVPEILRALADLGIGIGDLDPGGRLGDALGALGERLPP